MLAGSCATSFRVGPIVMAGRVFVDLWCREPFNFQFGNYWHNAASRGVEIEASARLFGFKISAAYMKG